MDRDEFRRWYETVAPDLRRYVMRICSAAEESDEVFQEAFTRLLASDFRSDDPRDRRRYLFRIATNIVRDRRRWTRRWGLTGWEDRGGRSPERKYAERVDVSRALARLPPRARALLWLAHVNRLPHGEIAEIAGVAQASVRVLLFRARKKLLRLLEGEEP